MPVRVEAFLYTPYLFRGKGIFTPGFTEQLIESLYLPRDMAILYFNKRGIGESTGNWKWGSIERRADDLLAAVEYLRAMPEIDPDAVGIIGHSQGGVYA